MPKINSDEHGRLMLPQDFLIRRHMPTRAEYWLDESENDLILHPRLPNAHKLYVEATTDCNLQCRTCIRNVWSDPEEQMKAETFERILESLAGLPDLNRVVFTSFGEPLSHPRFLEMIEQIRKHDPAVTVGSNGQLLTPEISRELVRLGIDRLVISVDGVRPETYAGVRGASLAQVLENIRVLNESKRQLGSLNPALGIEFVILKSNAAELADLSGLAVHLGAARVLVSNVLPYTEDMRAEILYGHEPNVGDAGAAAYALGRRAPLPVCP